MTLLIGSAKLSLTGSTLLRVADFILPFLMHSDALEMELGVILLQVFDSEEHPIIYMSIKPPLTEQCYAVVEWEALVIKQALFHV